MKISKSKQELARIISENGGWRDGAESAAQSSSDNAVSFYLDTASRFCDRWYGKHMIDGDIEQDGLISNWHQTVLSRTEYLHLYPAPDADGWIEWKGGECPVKRCTLVDVKYANGITNIGVSALTDKTHADHTFGTAGSLLATNWSSGLPMSGIIAYRLHKPEQSTLESRLVDAVDIVKSAVPTLMRDDMKFTGDEVMGERKPTIEQLAADYRSAKDYAERKQQEADAARADADENLRVLEIAGEALGLLVTPITTKQEHEMVIAVQVGDEVECIKSNVNPGKYMGRIGTVSSVDVDDTSTPYLVDFGGEEKIWCHKVKFIRRP